MFGTMGFSELIIILVIVLIIFGAGRLPQLGEGLGKALKGFKKEVHEVPPIDPQADAPTGEITPGPPADKAEKAPVAQKPAPDAPAASTPAASHPGPEATPGTTAALTASAAPQFAQPPRSKPATPAVGAAAAQAAPSGDQAPPPPHSASPPTMEQRMTQPPPRTQGVYPPLPPGAQPKPAQKRPSAIVNKEAVARVQARQAALKAKPAQGSGLSPQDMQGLGETFGDTLRTFRQAAADVQNAIDPEMRTIRAEMDAAQKEIEQSIETAKQMPAVQDEPPKSS